MCTYCDSEYLYEAIYCIANFSLPSCELDSAIRVFGMTSEKPSRSQKVNLLYTTYHKEKKFKKFRGPYAH